MSNAAPALGMTGSTSDEPPPVPVWWMALSFIAAVYLVALGGMLVYFGERGDSPGLGGLGLLNALIGVVVGGRQLMRHLI